MRWGKNNVTNLLRERAVLAVPDAVRGIQRFQFIAPFQDGETRARAMPALLTVPAYVDAEAGQLVWWDAWFDQDDLHSLLLAIAPEGADSRYWLHGWGQPNDLTSMEQFRVRAPRSPPETTEALSGLIYFATSLTAEAAANIPLPYGADDSSWWSVDICTGLTGSSEQLLAKCAGSSRAHRRSETPTASPDWLPWRAFVNGCIPEAQALVRQSRGEDAGVLLARNEATQDDLLRLAARALRRDLYVATGGLDTIVQLLDRGLPLDQADRLYVRPKRP